jgi:hypothetical protein
MKNGKAQLMLSPIRKQGVVSLIDISFCSATGEA